nr:adenylyltransferase/cytidyltransferase family protein [Acidobacteriota bacterium]
MIVTWNDLPELAGKVAMVDGSFDPIHEGHIAYFSAAESLGWPLLCNITSDEWTSTKHPVLLPQVNRAVVIDSVRHIRYTFCANSSTRDVLERLRPSMYIKGNDWLARGGVPEDERAVCERLGIEIRYVDTVLNSSSRLINKLRSS